jgi:hypothetical protein
MGVLVAGTDPDADVPRPSHHVPTAALVVAGIVVLALVAQPSSPGSSVAIDRDRPGVALSDSGRWIPWSRTRVLPFDARRLGELYLVASPGTVWSLDSEGVARSAVLPGVELVRGVSSDGNMAVAFGSDEQGPALWLSYDGIGWLRTRLPWKGSVQAATVADGAVIVIGVDELRARRIVATWSGRPGGGWRVLETTAPDAALLAVDGGFVARGRLGNEPVQYLHSTDGLTWEPFASRIVNTAGDVAAIVETAAGDRIRIPGDERLIRPPEWPIAAIWRVEERIWLQTPTAAWWSTDGSRWSRLPLDRRHGIERGSPVILPFEDRVAASVGGTVGSPQDLYMWILGA